MKTNQVLDLLKIFAWILFIGLCIETGTLLVSSAISIFSNTTDTKSLLSVLNFSEFRNHSQWHYICMSILTVIVSGLKAYLFYLVIKIISEVNIAHPFTEPIAKLISSISSIALQIGITAFITRVYSKWLMKHHLHVIFDSEETGFFFLAAILFVIAQIFKKGIELQSENELTI